MSGYFICESCAQFILCGEEHVHEGRMLCDRCYAEVTT